MKSFAQTINGLNSLTGRAKTLILDVWRGSDEYASAEKQDKCKVSKKKETLDAAK